MRHVLCISLAVLTASSLHAQLRTLPSGYENRGGEYLSGNGVLYPFARTVNFEYQEVHRDWNGTSQAPLTKIAFRRAPNRVANTSALAHTLSATITMGAGDYNTFSATFASNYTATPTVVVATRTINMPDWTQPQVPKEQFSIVIPLDAPYTVNTQSDFVWNLLIQNSTLPSIASALYYADRSAVSSASAAPLGTGCTTTGKVSPVTFTTTYANSGTTMSLAFAGTNFPASAGVVVHFGLANLNLPFPGLCGTVYARPDVAISAGPTTTAGALTTTTILLPFLPALRSLYFYTQAVAVDAGQPGLPVVVSEGREGGMAPGPVTKYTYSLNPPSSTGAGVFVAGSIITAY